MPQPLIRKKLKLNGPMMTYKTFQNTPKRCSFHHRGLEPKSRKSRDTWSNRQAWSFSIKEAQQRLTEFYQENTTRDDSTHAHHQMVYTKIRLIIFFAAKDGEVLYSQQKQDLELTVAQIMNSLLPNLDLN